MRYVLATILFFAVQPALAASLMKDGKGNHVRLTDNPCTSTAGALATIPAQLRPTLKAASVYWEGKDYVACYQDRGNHYVILDESGDGGALPKAAFRKEPEA